MHGKCDRIEAVRKDLMKARLCNRYCKDHPSLASCDFIAQCIQVRDMAGSVPRVLGHHIDAYSLHGSSYKARLLLELPMLAFAAVEVLLATSDSCYLSLTG